MRRPGCGGEGRSPRASGRGRLEDLEAGRAVHVGRDRPQSAHAFREGTPSGQGFAPGPRTGRRNTRSGGGERWRAHLTHPPASGRSRQSGHRRAAGCPIVRRDDPSRRHLARGLRRSVGRGHAGRRPAVVVSADPLDDSRAGVVTVVPCTTRRRELPLHVELDPKCSGLDEVSCAKCEDAKSASEERLVARLGAANDEALFAITRALRFLLDF